MNTGDFSTFYQLSVGYKEGEHSTVYANFILEDTRVYHTFPAWSESTLCYESDTDSDVDEDVGHEYEEEWKPSIPCVLHYYARIDCPQCITSYEALRERRHIHKKLQDYETIVLFQENTWKCLSEEIPFYQQFLREREIPLDRLCFLEKSGEYAYI